MIHFNLYFMNCYLILYDLRSPNIDYNTLYYAIKRLGSWGRLTETSWAVLSDKSHIDIRNYLSSFVGESDRLIIIRSGREAAWTRVLASDEWVRNNLVL